MRQEELRVQKLRSNLGGWNRQDNGHAMFKSRGTIF